MNVTDVLIISQIYREWKDKFDGFRVIFVSNHAERLSTVNIILKVVT